MKSPPGGGREGDFFVPSVGGDPCRGCVPDRGASLHLDPILGGAVGK